MALFVVNIGLSPSEYRELTITERDALLTEFKRVNTKR